MRSFFRFLVPLTFLFSSPAGAAHSLTLTPLIIEKKEIDLPGIDMLSPDTESSVGGSGSVEELLEGAGGIDLRERAGFGLQGDLSIRGSVFEDAEIVLGGISWRDPQTGHYTLEVPFSMPDIERVVLDENAQNVRFMLKRPQKKEGVFQSFWGEHALFGSLLSVAFPLRSLGAHRMTFEHKTSSGARQDTDFELFNGSYYGFFEGDQDSMDIIFGATERNFGAGSFYSAMFPHEEEHIAQKLFIISTHHDRLPFRYDTKCFYRRHKDTFILNRNDPSFFTNRHTTHVYGFEAQAGYKNIHAGFRLSNDAIKSSNLGIHTRDRQDIYCRFISSSRSRSIALNVQSSHYDRFGWLQEADVRAGIPLTEKLWAYLLSAYAWRPPSYTELYYMSPANNGNVALDVQKTWNVELQFVVKPHSTLRCEGGLFVKTQRDTIDWVKSAASDPWAARNIGTFRIWGAQAAVDIQLKERIVKNITLRYTYLTADDEKPFSFSKYAFDYLAHKVTVGASFEYKGVQCAVSSRYHKPRQRNSYFLCDIRLEKELKKSFSIFLEGTNIFNTDYEPLEDIDGEGRWYRAGISMRF